MCTAAGVGSLWNVSRSCLAFTDPVLGRHWTACKRAWSTGRWVGVEVVVSAVHANFTWRGRGRGRE